MFGNKELEKRIEKLGERIRKLEIGTSTRQDDFGFTLSYVEGHWVNVKQTRRIGKLVDLILDHLGLEFKHIDEDRLVSKEEEDGSNS